MASFLRKLVATMSGTMVCGALFAVEYEVGGLKYNITVKAQIAEVIGGDNCSSEIVIPATFLYEGQTITVVRIGKAAFRFNSALTSVVIPESVTEIGQEAFRYCKSLKSVSLPGTVAIIETAAFYGCTSMTTVRLPQSVSSIGACAFANCTELTDFYCANPDVPATYTSVFGNSNVKWATLHVKASAVHTYSTMLQWKEFGKIQSM